MVEHVLNKRGKTIEVKPTSEIVRVAVPPIIGRDTFAAMQKPLEARNRKIMPARTSPNRLKA